MEFERRAAIMGGGNFVVPVQTVTDFMENKVSGNVYLCRFLDLFLLKLENWGKKWRDYGSLSLY